MPEYAGGYVGRGEVNRVAGSPCRVEIQALWTAEISFGTLRATRPRFTGAVLGALGQCPAM